MRKQRVQKEKAPKTLRIKIIAQKEIAIEAIGKKVAERPNHP